MTLSESPASRQPNSALTEDFDDLYENAPCGYLSLDPHGTIVKANATLGKWLELESNVLVGSRFRDHLKIGGRVYYETHLLPLLRMQGFVNEVALDVLTGKKELLAVIVNAVERRDLGGQLLFTRITLFNSADRRRYEREILEARAKADIANSELQALNETLECRVAEAVALRLQLENSLRQSQKMEVVGQLTGGIAHDFNNLLAGILGSVDLLGLRVKQGRLDILPRYIDAAKGAAMRAAALTHRLLAFSRQQKPEPKVANLNRLVADMEDLIRRTIGVGIAFKVMGAEDLWSCMIDQNQMENALLNLCINARDAMPGGGRLTIETANQWLDEAAARDRDLSSGQYVTISVTDTGTGMSAEVIARAFDPFFTTKPEGVGTGLGLSMVFGFARQSNGQVCIYSEFGQGTTMSIYLPRHRGEVTDTDVPPSLMRPAARTESATILVVDNEPTVRLLVTEVLEDAGYHVLESADGLSALKALQSAIDIDLLITDVDLPGGFSGSQLAAAASLLRENIKVLFLTGYEKNDAVGNGNVAAEMAILIKPFSIEALLQKMRKLLPHQDT